MSGSSPPRERNTGSSGASSSKNTNNGFSRFEEPEQRLLPGIPDELGLISPKLSWKVFYILSSVSSSWRRVIRNREVYNARVLSQATEKLVVVNNFITRADTDAIGLYSVSDESFYQLPPIPNGSEAIHQNFKCISMDGKIYALGGGGYSDCSRDDVYVLDLAAQRQWKQCKSMGSARWHFGLGVVGEKIYVFGGFRWCGYLVEKRSQMQMVRGSEMYDPQFDTWYPIDISRIWGFTEVTTIGEELFLHGGLLNDFRPYIKRETSLQVYHPDKDVWRKVTPVERDLGRDIENQFISQEQLYSMTKTGIHAYDMENKSWTPRHSFSCAEITHALDSGCLKSWTTIALDNELVTILSWYTVVYDPQRGSHEIVSPEGQYLLHSIGFGGQQETIVWQKADCSFQIKPDPTICLIQL